MQKCAYFILLAYHKLFRTILQDENVHKMVFIYN